MPEESPDFMERQEILTYEEIERFVRVGVQLGIRKIRLTGGEPLLRRGLPLLVRKLAAVPGIIDLALTTNGLLLSDVAGPLFDAGLRRINIHVDTLDPRRFRQIVRRDGLQKVLDGIFRCKSLGYGPIKINAVAVRGLTEEDIVPLALFGREHGVEVRFIEFMPLDADDRWQQEKVLRAADIIDKLSREISPLVSAPDR
jgi:cyclic pyranopterin phosphate synthase